MSEVCVWFTASLVRPDGSDTNAYGEGCERGQGYTEESGWLDPDWTLWEVFEEREQVRADRWSPDDGPLIEWLVGRVEDRVGWVEINGDGSSAFYASDSVSDHRTGAECLIAAHIHGVPNSVVSAVWYTLAFRQRRARGLA